MGRGFQTMIDMARTTDEVRKEVSSMGLGAKPTAPVYGYGLCISLDENDLAKLGMNGDLPEVGEMIHLAAMAKVTSVSESEREDTDGNKTKCCRVELQITHLAVPENEDDEVEMAVQKSAGRRKRFYGDSSSEEDAA